MAGGAGDSERIDLIAADSELFVDTPAQSAGRTWQVLQGLAVVAGIVVAAVVWWPRAEPPKWRTFPTAPIPAAGLTDQLVFDDPVGQLAFAELPPAPEDFEQELGYVFAEPGDTIETGRWALFRTHTTNSSARQVATEGPQVGDVHADVSRPHFIQWGPVDRRVWTVTTNQFTADEALNFANHVAIVDDQPALAQRYDLGAMQPVGSVAALDCVQALTELLRGNHLLRPVRPTMVKWATTAAPPPNPRYDGASTVGSIPAPADALPLVEFVLGDGTATKIHGQPAVVITAKDLGPVIAWLEDGRLVIVMADLATDELIALAESVRPARSSGEWRSIQRAAAQGFNYGFSTEIPTTVTVYRADDPDTGIVLSLTLTLHSYFDEVVSIFACAEERTAGGVLTETQCNVTPSQLPLLTFAEGNGRLYVVAIVGRVGIDSAELRVQLADGGFKIVPLEELSIELPGPAAAILLPRDYSSVQLLVNGEPTVTVTRAD